jgi:hypothetical protein
MNQNRAAAVLGYSRSHISRMLAEARRDGIVEIHVHHPLARVAALEQRLADQFGLQEVRVLKSNGVPYSQMLRRLGALAAGLLVQKITPNSILGISWGTALFEVSNMLAPIDYPEVKVVQLIGSATSRDHQVDGRGLAVALEQGLIVLVVHQADQKNLFQIGAEVGDLSKRAREGGLFPQDVMDCTFTISNLGMFAVDQFTAIINPPQVAILAVGRTTERFVPDESRSPVLRPMMAVTLSADHRVVDGAEAARFLTTLQGILETAGAQWA